MLSSSMRKLNITTLFLTFLIMVSVAGAQDLKIRQADWQQTVNYDINVSLDDQAHMLRGNIEIQYVNNSPDELKFIMFHLWPNAYKNNNTAFARQQLGNGSTNFYFAKEEERGWIDSLDFHAGNNDLEWNLDENNIDIAKVMLAEPLASGDTVTLSTTFKVKIPGTFSRFGHVDNGYQITQWYPKPAVYDVNGWNAMPYLDQGEFYSEYGRFEVTITVPLDYIVAATGELQDSAEWDYLRSREKKPLKRIAQKDLRKTKFSNGAKTMTFIQDKVHDFAWFADKSFNVTTSRMQLPSGDTMTTMIFTTEEYDAEDCAKYVSYTEEAILYYSRHVGVYPYKYCSVVQGALLAGGGMEYPMVTVIPDLNEEVIVHEVGHNWFYGILGSNERTYPWMDEGINSFFTDETIQSKKKRLQGERDPLGKTSGFKAIAGNPTGATFNYISRDEERAYLNQPIGLDAADFTSLNYGTMVYGKGSMMFKHLEKYLGSRTFERCFKAYFDTWKFRHPLPGDMQDVFEKESGKDLSWFFVDLINSDGRLDYQIDEVRKNIGKATITNKGDIVAPFPLAYILGDEIVKTVWIEGFEGSKEIDLNNIEYDAIKIDPEEIMMETYTKNNTYRINATFHKIEPFRLNYLFAIEDPNRTQLSWSPAIGWNSIDYTMAGFWLTNMSFPRKNFEFATLNLYSSTQKDWNGLSTVRYTDYNKSGKLSSTQFGVNIAAFSHYLPGLYTDTYQYRKLEPFVKFNFRSPSPRSKLYRSLTVKSYLIDFIPKTSKADRLSEIQLSDTSRRSSFDVPNGRAFFVVSYKMENKRVLNPYSIKLNMEYGLSSGTRVWLDSSKTVAKDAFLKVEFTGKYKITYPFKNKGLNIRVFTGAFLDTSINSAFQFATNNTNTTVAQPDYKYDQVQMGRGVQSPNILANQLMMNGPYLKNVGLLSVASKYIAAVNLESGVPFKLPLGVYMDVFTFNGIENMPFNDDNQKFGYSGGVYVDLFKGFFKLYAPLFASTFINKAQEFRQIDYWGQKLTFTLNLNLFDPFRTREKVYHANL